MKTGTAKRLWALDAPTLTVDRGIMIVGGSGKVTIPMPAYLIEHPKGLVLFDTSIVPDAAGDPESVYGPLATMFEMAFTPEQRVDRQLEALGYRTSDVTHVVASHAHFDHTGGLYLFPDASFIVGPDEMRFAYWPDPAGAGFFRCADLDAARGYRWLQMPGGDHDMFDDGSLVVLHTPGHTPGELSLLVRLPGRTFVLTGDALHVRESLETEVHAPYDYDPVAAQRSIRRLKLLRDATDATIWISHDPDDWAEYGHAPVVFE